VTKRRTGTSEQRKRRARHLKSTYGITLDDYEALLTAQHGACAICGATEPGGRGRFHIDHCHDKGGVRGLLCANCNQGLGKFKDSPSLLYKAAAYLAASRFGIPVGEP